MTQIATLLFVAGILGLFYLDWDRRAKASLAIWIPVVWLGIAMSRPVSEWFGIQTEGVVGLEEGNPFERNVYLALLTMSVLVLVTRWPSALKILKANGPILLLVVYAAASIGWSEFPAVAFKRWIKFVGDIVMVLVVLTERDHSKALERVLARLAFLIVPLSVLLIKYYPAYSRYYSRWEGAQFFRGVSADKNMLGMACLIVGIGSAWRLLRESRTTRKTRFLVAHGTILLMIFWLFRIADSMTSLACFLLGSLMLATSVTRMGQKPAFVGFVVPVALVSCILFVFFGGSLLTLIGRDPTLTGRTVLWDQVIAMNPNPFLGVGFESFWLGDRLATIWAKHWWTPNQAHNGYIETYLNLGWVGIGVVWLVILAAYRNVLTLLKRDPEAGQIRLAFFAVAIIYNCTEAAIKMLHPVWIAFLFAAITLPESAQARNLGRRAQIWVRKARPAPERKLVAVETR
jgi:O-antigen ligase